MRKSAFGAAAAPRDPPPRNLWQITAGERLRYAAATAATGISNAFMLAAPVVAMYAIDVIAERDLAAGAAPVAAVAAHFGARAPASDAFIAYAILSAIAALLLAALGSVFLYLRGRWTAIAAEAIAERLRGALFRSLHDLPAAFFDRADTGDLVQRCSSDVETVRVFLSTHVVEIGRSALLIAAMAPILFWRDARLAALGLCLIPFIGAGAYVFFSRVKAEFRAADEAEGALTAVLQENLSGIRVVRAFARQEHEIARFGEKNRLFRNRLHRLIKLEAVYWGLSDFLSLGQIGLVLIAGGFFLAEGTITVGELFAFLALVSMAIWPVRRLGHVLADAGKAIIALGRINHILQAQSEDQAEREGADGGMQGAPPPRAAGAIVFENVGAGYLPGQSVIDGFSVAIGAGQTVGIVGPPGSGKSTLMRLLMRLYPIRAGRILLDGRDIRAVDRRWLRAQIGAVMQEPFLYARSVADNLRVARADAADGALVAAAREAAIHETIAGFPQGYDAAIGERGITLSGGQRQRLALARALLKEPPILVLDDSLSAVDTETERRILDALERRRGRHTTIVIAHRLSSVRDADRILVVEGGRLVQDGTHDSLAAAPGPYRRLCDIQGALDASIRREARAASN